MIRTSLNWPNSSACPTRAVSSPAYLVLSLGTSRRFGLRPRGGGAGHWFALEGGDLLVMGGRSQHDWEHTVPKSARGGPRISVTYRHAEPRSGRSGIAADATRGSGMGLCCYPGLHPIGRGGL
ncbi:MAG: alpha-ketoglutarate-dependent dioxygenase AlkB [Pseudonocardiaceae bacterium]